MKYLSLILLSLLVLTSCHENSSLNKTIVVHKGDCLRWYSDLDYKDHLVKEVGKYSALLVEKWVFYGKDDKVSFFEHIELLSNITDYKYKKIDCFDSFKGYK